MRGGYQRHMNVYTSCPRCVDIHQQGRQSGVKTGGVVGPCLRTGCSTGYRVSSPKFLFNYMQICLFLNGRHFSKAFLSLEIK